MTIDVIIPVYRPDAKFVGLIEGLRRQSVAVHKIIIMYTRASAEDSFAGWCREVGVRVDAGEPVIEIHELDQSEFDHGGTRNRGAQFSEADYLLFMTDDAVPADDFLVERLMEGMRGTVEELPKDPDFVGTEALGFAELGVAVCYARQLPREDATLAERFSREFNYPDADRLKSKADIGTMGIKAFFCSNVCALYNKKIFDALGGFVNRTVFNEDMIYARKALDAGYCIQYKADARVIHSHAFSDREQFQRNVLLARSQKEHPEVFADVSSEAEGFKYVKSAYAYFRKNGKGYLIVPFIVTCGFRFAGYRVGKFTYRKRK